MIKKIVLSAMAVVAALFPIVGVQAISAEQENTISGGCDSIKQTLKIVQSEDSRTRVYLGGYYEKILSKYITPLNLRLVKNNLADAGLAANQASFVTERNNFAADFINYQKSLEELIAMDCKKEPAKFYENLEVVRGKRDVMVKDVAKMKELILENVNAVQILKEKL